jgi:hypothetical protein
MYAFRFYIFMKEQASITLINVHTFIEVTKSLDMSVSRMKRMLPRQQID